MSSTDAVKCPKCGNGFLQSRKNKTTGEVFFGCSNYPECKAAFPADNKGNLIMVQCPQCGAGYLRVKDGRNGKFFLCNNYPECQISFEVNKDGTPNLSSSQGRPKVEVSEKYKCHVCGSPLARRESRKRAGTYFWSCTRYKKNDPENTCLTIYFDKNGAPDYESVKGK